jgi:hypothetical protein
VSHGTLQPFLWGALAMACFVAGLYFLRFWRSTRDRFFVFFLLAFWVLGVQWTLLAWTFDSHEERPTHYAMRLVAFGLIIVGVVDKNRRGR